VSVVSFAKTTISIRGNTSLDAVTARFGAISESVTAHGSVTVTPRTGSPKISVTGNSSSVNVSGVAGRTNISPHGNVSAVSSSSVVSLKVSVPEVPSPVLVSAVTGSPRIFVTDQVSKVTVKAYTEGVAFAGTVSHVSASAAFGGLSVKTTGMVSLVSSASHLGSAGGQFIEGHLDRLRWGAELIRPVEWE
jgi:hypothetical protein